MDNYKDIVQQEKLLKPKLYTYPEWDQPVAVFDFEELENEEALLVLCVRKADDEEYREEETCYVWVGPDFDIDHYEESANMDLNGFVQKCITDYWGGDGSFDMSKIKILNEDAHSPSEAFMNFFDWEETALQVDF